MQAAVKQQVRNGQPGKYINITPLWAQVARETTRRAAQTSDYYRNIAENQGALYNGSVPVYSAWLGRYGYNRALKNDEGAPPFLQRYGARSYYTDLVVDALTLALPVKGLRLPRPTLALADMSMPAVESLNLWDKVPKAGMNPAEIKDVWGGGVVAGKPPLSYDISKWSEYGLPSDGTFVRTLTPKQYRDLKAGRNFYFAGSKQPDYGYPEGMGFIGSAEEVNYINTVSGYREALKLDYDPKYIMEFQLRDPLKLQNVLDAPWDEFVRGGKTGAGFSEWNYPGINSADIINPTVRVLK